MAATAEPSEAALRRGGGSDRGFTLIELLVVLGIFMLLMGLAIGAVTRQPRVDRIIGAEQAVSDVIRQARHTARTTGQPVVVRLTQGSREIAGLSRTALWSGLDGWPAAGDPVPGRTGDGLYIGRDATDGAYGDPANPDASLIAPDPTTLASLAPGDPKTVFANLPLVRNQRLARGVTAEPPPGLLLSLWVRPPVATDTSPYFLPLAMVGPDDDSTSADFAKQDRSAFGIALWRVDPGAYAPGAPGAMPDTRDGPPVRCWDAIGWLDDGTKVYPISAIDRTQAAKDQVRDETAATLVTAGGSGSQVTATDIASPIYGGEWIELGLLFDGARLVLYRDGRRIAETPCAPTQFSRFATPPAVSGERVFVGAARAPAAADPTQKLVAAAGATIDDVRLERVGQAMAGRFPSGVLPDRDRRITCHPDGRVEVDADGANAAQAVAAVNSNIIYLHTVDDAGSVGDHAELEVSLDGTVVSRTVVAK